MMRMAVLQHVQFEGPAAVADWAAARGSPLRLFHLHRDPTQPLLADFDMLTVMGGPMSANDEARLAWSRDCNGSRGHSRGQDRAWNLPRRPDHRQSLGRAGLSWERQRNRLVPCPANGLTSFLRRHTR